MIDWREFAAGAAIAAILLSAMLLLGCSSAPERYLTQEQDEQMRAACADTGGCTVIPNPIWMQIQQILHALWMRQS